MQPAPRKTRDFRTQRRGQSGLQGARKVRYLGLLACVGLLSCNQAALIDAAAPPDRCEEAMQRVLTGDVAGNPSLPSDNGCNTLALLARDAVFVDGSNAATAQADGSPSHPFRTIQAGLQGAEKQRRRAVVIAKGVYPETVHLVSGISLYGGFDAATGWSRSLHHETIVAGTVKTGDGEAQMGMRGQHIVAPTLLSMVSIRVPTGPSPGQSSYGLYCLTCPSLQLRDVAIEAGAGTAGLAGLESPEATTDFFGPRKGLAGTGGQRVVLVDNELVAEPGTPGNAEADEPDAGITGIPGGGGEGGGNSIGIFAKNSNGMNLQRCRVRSGNGGPGGPGGNSVLGENAGGGGAGGASFGTLLVNTVLTIGENTSVQHSAGGRGGISPSSAEQSSGKPGPQGAIVSFDNNGILTGLCHSDCNHSQDVRQ